MNEQASAEPTVHELFDLTGKAALITGGTGHLGSAMSRALAEAGASVVVSSRDATRARQAAGALPSPGGARHHGVALDAHPDVVESEVLGPRQPLGEREIDRCRQDAGDLLAVFLAGRDDARGHAAGHRHGDAPHFGQPEA